MVYNVGAMKTIDVDGAELYLLSYEEAEKALHDEKFGGVELARPDILKAHLSITKGTPEFEIALGRPSGHTESWVIVHVLKYGEKYVRVRAEGLTCFSCGQVMIIGNPMDYQIYEGANDPMGSLAKAKDLPLVPCPACHKDLPRPAIIAHKKTASLRPPKP